MVHRIKKERHWKLSTFKTIPLCSRPVIPVPFCAEAVSEGLEELVFKNRTFQNLNLYSKISMSPLSSW